MAKKKKTVTAPAVEVKADTTDKKVENKTAKATPVVAEKPAKKSAATTNEKKTTKKATETKSASKTTKTATAAKATKEVKAEEAVKAPKVEKATKSAKTATKATKAASSDDVKVQFGVDEYDVESIKKAVEADFRSKYTGHYKNVQIYIKPEEKTAYYVVNSKFSDKITL